MSDWDDWVVLARARAKAATPAQYWESRIEAEIDGDEFEKQVLCRDGILRRAYHAAGPTVAEVEADDDAQFLRHAVADGARLTGVIEAADALVDAIEATTCNATGQRGYDQLFLKDGVDTALAAYREARR